LRAKLHLIDAKSPLQTLKMAKRSTVLRLFSVLIPPIKAGCLIIAQFLPSFVSSSK